MAAATPSETALYGPNGRVSYTDGLLVRALKGKLAARDELHPYNITPSRSDSVWIDAVFEARGHGVPIAAFGDTSDKLVFHLGPSLARDAWR